MVRRRAALLLALLLVILLVPSARADHAYSHRYLVVGKVVDAEGLPVPDVIVRMGATFRTEGACASNLGAATDAWGPDAMQVTNEHGEFWLCAHAHALLANASNGVQVVALGPDGLELANASLVADPDVRISYVTLVAQTATGGEPSADHLVVGRVWSPWVPGEPLDGVEVNGLARTRQNVTVIVEAGGRTSEATTSTNSYGDFAVRVPVDATEGRVTVRAAGAETTTELGAHGWTSLKLKAGPAAEAILLGQGVAWREPGGAEDNPMLRVLPGAEVTLLAVALDEGEHLLVVDKLAEARAVSGRGDLAYANFTAPASGVVAYYCSIHRAQGMEGRILVVGAVPGGPPVTPPTATSGLPTPTHADTVASGGPPATTTDTPLPPMLAALALVVAIALARRPYP